MKNKIKMFMLSLGLVGLSLGPSCLSDSIFSQAAQDLSEQNKCYINKQLYDA